MFGPKGPTVTAEGCSPLQELEKAAHRAAIFLVLAIIVLKYERIGPSKKLKIIFKTELPPTLEFSNFLTIESFPANPWKTVCLLSR